MSSWSALTQVEQIATYRSMSMSSSKSSVLQSSGMCMICRKRDEATHQCECCGIIMCRVCDPRAGYRYFPPSNTMVDKQDTVEQEKSRKAKLIQKQIQRDEKRIASRWIPRGIIKPPGRTLIENIKLKEQLTYKREFTDLDHFKMGIDDIPADACAQDETGNYFVVFLPKRVMSEEEQTIIKKKRVDNFLQEKCVSKK